jgi:hypothetical protein
MNLNLEVSLDLAFSVCLYKIRTVLEPEREESIFAEKFKKIFFINKCIFKIPVLCEELKEMVIFYL